ncbi:abortive infection system antitoxin AbiGi family protein [Flavobacterium sp. LC2016-12]|uniref:abortive infection system antitoxin AbiGi family protein n=1 Tax=Flavobacterium sp. LC2016-12 TaxID=2783794 RepID=UPI00188AB7EB|nr:abortive infection system antitoxin AbiGi family protein [Flavobacterium sp. LC2016-12]MBF4463643.1 hypothetical protein [Flavobacterium sp. LC2016-12]
MSISTNSVIHYTSKLDNLKGIISTQGFKLKYCSENLKTKSRSLSSAIPMLSFCDIPLSEVKNHLDSYGFYGIGLTKDWAKEKGLNPVLYLEKESILANHIGTQYKRIAELHKTTGMDLQLQNEFTNFLSYCKNYEGKLVHEKINTNSYRFYDEREWRYVASKEDLNGAPVIVSGKNYLKEKNKYNEKIKDCVIKFSFKDISYIIVEDENDIPSILKILNETYENQVGCTSRDLKILSTKIITKNQICNDF